MSLDGKGFQFDEETAKRELYAPVSPIASCAVAASSSFLQKFSEE
jgi:hypothetical protein